MTSRRALLGCVIAAAASVVAAAPAPAADDAGALAAVVDDGLLRSVAAGPAPAVLSWDRRVADRQDVVAHLARNGLRATVLDGLSVALACAARPADVRTLAGAPGAVSVWGEETLELAGSVPTSSSAGSDGAAVPGLGVDGSGVSVAVVDTGLDGRHPDVADHVRANARVLVSHREFLGPGDPPPCQDFYAAELEDSELTSGHGTHLAGVAVGDGTASNGRVAGLAPGAEVVGVGVSDSVVVDTDVRDSTRLSMLGALAGLNYALVNGLDGEVPVKVVVAGWVGKGLYDPYHPIALAIRDLHDFGLSVVFPVGNGGQDDSDCSTAGTCTVNPYAVGPYAIGVAATDDSGALAGFSSRGDPTERSARGLPVAYEPLLAAPGVDVVAARRIGTANAATPPGTIHAGGGSPTADQTDARYVAMSGTSVAAAHVAGAVALMQHAALEATGCYLDAYDVRRLLAETAAPVAGSERWQAGAGALDVAAAVAAAREVDPVENRDPWMCPSTQGAAQ